MTADQMSIGELLAATVPMVRTLNLEYLETTPEKAVLALPDQSEYRNHVGGPHAGAMFTLGESASGAIVLAAFGDQLSRAVPLPVTAEIAFRKIALGPVTATATLDRPIAMGYVPRAFAMPGTMLAVDVRGKQEPAKVVKLPFYKR